MTKRLPLWLMAALILGSLVFVGSLNPTRAGTSPPTIISTDQTWTAANSPYNLVGPTRVNAGVTLTLEPGATVNIGGYYLQVDGALYSVGNANAPVRIISNLGVGLSDVVGYLNFTDNSIGWDGQTGCVFENTVINQTIIYVNNPMVKINQNTINFAGNMMLDNVALRIRAGTSPVTNNIINGAVIMEGGTSSINGNTITGGMGLYGGSPTVTNNQVSGGSTYIYFAKDENRVYNAIAVNAYCSPTITNNQIRGSIGFGDYRGYQASAIITGNTITNGGIGCMGNVVISNNKVLGGGISANGPNVTIQSNQISVPSATAITVSDNVTVKYNTVIACAVGIQVNNPLPSGDFSRTGFISSPTIKNNNIQGWTAYAIKTQTANDIDVTNNYWGTTDTQIINAAIYDQGRDFNLGKIVFLPILSTPETSAPISTSPQTPTPNPTTTYTPSPSPIVPEFPTPILVALFCLILTAVLGLRKNREMVK